MKIVDNLFQNAWFFFSFLFFFRTALIFLRQRKAKCSNFIRVAVLSQALVINAIASALHLHVYTMCWHKLLITFLPYVSMLNVLLSLIMQIHRFISHYSRKSVSRTSISFRVVYTLLMIILAKLKMCNKELMETSFIKIW